MSPLLSTLPREVLFQVCDMFHEDDPSAVFSFVLCSEYCYQAAQSVLFRHLRFKVTSQRELANHVKKCTRLLQARDAFRHVRSVAIVGPVDSFLGGRDQGFFQRLSSGESTGDRQDDYCPWHPSPFPPRIGR